MRTTLADVARNVSCLQLQTNSLSRTLASELGARDSRNHSAGPLHFREQPASGVQSVPSPRDSNSKLHARLDDIARLLQSNIDATRNEHADKCPLAGVPKYEDYAMSGVQAAPSPTDQSAGVHARLDELTTFVKSNTDTHRKSHSASVASIQKLVLNIEKMISRNMVDLRTELREIKNTLPATRKMQRHSTINNADKDDKASELDLQDDPRKTIAAFFQKGDDRGPCGSLQLSGLASDGSRPDSKWFAVFRPTSSEAISKMVFGDGAGKGLNVKGKSARKGVLSGFVPFLQISDNVHRQQLLSTTQDSRFQLFFTSADSRSDVKVELEKVLQEMTTAYEEAQRLLEEMRSGAYAPSADEEQEAYQKIHMGIDSPHIEELSEFEPVTFGIDIPERLFREVYVNRKDMSEKEGWGTGRTSFPAFANMNIQAVRESMRQYRQGDGTKSRVVLYQVDKEDPMNPHALVMAYADPDAVKPVVSDFDALLVGSKGVRYEPLAQKQADLVCWSLEKTQEILSHPSTHPWSARWIHTLKSEADKGFHPDLPEFGFGDPTTYKVFEDLVASTKASGAVRHGAECFNFYFPQDLDPEYLVIWEGFGAKKPWAYLSEPDLRSWLLERVTDGFCFPLNPVWPVRDAGWYEVLQALRSSMSASQALGAWYPHESGILAKIDAIHAKHPGCFSTDQQDSKTGTCGILDAVQNAEIKETSMSIQESAMSALEAADFGLHEVRRHVVLKRARRKLKAYMLLSRMIRKGKP